MAKIICPTRENKDFSNLSNAIGSDALARYVWLQHGNLPLNVTEDSEGNIVPNETYERILNEVADGNENLALGITSLMYYPSFKEKYAEEDPAFIVDYIKQEAQDKQEKAARRQAQVEEEKIIPGTKTLYIQSPEGDVVYTQEEGKEIFDSLEYLASIKKGWKGVVESLKERVTDIQTKIKNGASDPEVTVTPQELLIGKNLVNLLKHWPQVKAWYLSQDTNFGLELLEDEVNQETGGSVYNKNAHERSQMDLASAEVIKLVQSLPRYNKLTTQDRKDVKEGKKSITDFQVISNLTGFPVVGTFSTNWNVLTSSLSGITKYDKILQELEVVAQEYPQFRDLANMLPKEDIQDADLKTANFVASFVQTVSLPEIGAYQLSIGKRNVGKEVKLTSKVFKLGTRTVDNLIRYFDEDYFKSNPSYGILNDEGKTVLNIPKLLADFRGITDIRRFFADKNDIDSPEGRKLLQGIHKFYNALGIIPSNALYQKDKKALYDFLADTTFEVRELYDKLEASIDDKTVTQPLQFLARPQGSGKQLGPKFDIVNKIVGYYGKFEREFASGSYYNPEDKLQYNRVQYFYLTQVTNALNSVNSYNELISKPEFAHLDFRLNPNILGSVWMERMFGVSLKGKTIGQLKKELDGGKEFPRLKTKFSKEPFKIDIVNYSGLSIDADVKKGVTTTELTAEDKITQDFISFFAGGVVENIRFGDKGTSYATVTSGKIEERIYVPLNSEIMGMAEKPTSVVEQALVAQFKDYLTSEVYRILAINKDTKKHTYNKNGRQLFLFKDMLPKEDYDALTSEDDAVVKEAYGRVVNQLPTYLGNYFAEQTKAYKSRLLDSVLGDTSAIMSSITEEQKEEQLVNSINALGFMDPALSKVGLNKNNLDYVIANYLKNDFIHKAEFMKVFVGDIANFQVKGDFREVFKRIPLTSSPGFVFQDNPVVMAHLNNSSGTNGLYKALRGGARKFGKTVRTVVFNDVNTFSKEDWPTYRAALGLPDTMEYQEYVNSPKEADAQGLVSLDFYRNYLIGLGQWSQEQENAYLNEIEIFKILNKKEKTEEDYAKMQELKASMNYVGFPPLKLGHYGPIVEDPKLTALHKYSLAPMIPSMVAGTQLEELNKQMIAKQIDYATFNSGSKASNYGDALDFYVPDVNNQETLKVNPSIKGNNVTTLHLTNLKQQQYIAPKFKNEATLATQMVKLIFGDFFAQGKLTDLNASTAKTISDLYKDYTNVLGNIIGAEEINLFNKLGISKDAQGNIVGFDNKKFYNFLKGELEKRDTSASLKRYIQLDEAGNIKYPLDATKNRAEIENILLSIINNKVISQKLHGESYVQMASTAQGNTRFTKSTEEQIKKYGINGLRFYRKGPDGTEPADVKIAFNPKKHAGLLNLTFRGKKIGTIENLNKILKSDNREAIDWVNQHTKKLSLVGVRIPVQGLNSMEYFRVREFLPTSAGPVIVVPAQIVVKSGSDFDIDKLTMFEPKLDANGEIVGDGGFDLGKYRESLPSQKEAMRMLKTLIEAKQALSEVLAVTPVYVNKKQLEKEIQELTESISSTEEEIGKFSNKKMNLEELQALMSEGSSEKENLIKAKIEEAKALAKSGDLAASLPVLKALKSEIKNYVESVNGVRNFKQANVNKLIDIFTSVLSMKENYDKLVLPNTNTVLTEISDKLNANPITSTELFSPLTSNRVYGDNIESKKALGIDAKLNTMQKEFQIAGLVYTNELSFMYPFSANKVGEGISLGEKTLTDGTSISRVISEAINGHVDIAKEDWIILLGLDKAKTPLFHAMILAGTPVKTALDFLNKPVVKYVLKESTRGPLFQQLGGRRGRRTDLTFNDILLDTFYELDSSEETYSIIQGSIVYNNSDDIKIKESILNIRSSVGSIENKEVADKVKDLVDLYMIKQLQGSIQQLTSLVDYNTKRFQNSYQVKADKITLGRIYSSFNSEGLNKLINKSALSKFNQSNSIESLMPQIFDVSNHPSVLDAITTYSNKAKLFVEEDLVKASRKVKDNYLVAMVQLFGVDNTGTKLQDKFFSKAGLLTKSNPNNLAKRIADIQEKYSDLSKNQVLANLYTAETNSDNVIFKLRNANLDSYLIGEYEKAFIAGLNDVRPDVREVFQNLGLGTFLQFGFAKNSYGLSQIIPYETYVTHTTQAVARLKEGLQDEQFSKSISRYIGLMTYFNDSKNVPTLVLNSKVADDAYNADYLVTVGRDADTLDSALRDIANFKSKSYTNFENIKSKGKFRGLPIELVDVIPTKKTTPVAMRNREGTILIDEKAFIKKFNDKAWTEPVKQSDDTFATPLALDEFQSIEEFLTFALIHETKHNTVKRVDGETEGQYEDRVNQAALQDLRYSYRKGQAITPVPFQPLNVPTQPSTSVAEFDLADKLPPIEQNFTDGTGGRKMQPQFEGKSTMDLIISGDRTRTTRAKTDIQRMAKDYGLSKISDLVGKVIRMTDKTGRQVYTTITNVVPFTQEYQDATWQNEGWEKSVTDKHVGNYPYAIEFKVVDKPTQTSTSVKIKPTDKIIWGHPTIGKTTANQQNNFFDFDTDFKPLVAQKLGLPKSEQNSIGLNKWRKTGNEEEFNKAMREVWSLAKAQAKQQNKMLMVSDMLFLKENASDFDKIINIPSKTFIERAVKRGDNKEILQSWKTKIDKTLEGVDQNKIITTNKYLSDLLPTQSSTIVNPEEYTNYSGGAIGGDTVWAEFGKEYGLGKQVDYTPATLKKLTSDQLQEVEAAYQKAVKDLGRKPLSQDTYAGGLVRRDYLQAKAADAIYAVSTLIEPGQKDAKGYINNTNKKIVSGGTGYAVQMAINLDKTVFVFNQADNTWWMYDNTRGEFGVYGATPILTKNFAGIGTREINEAGKQAIRDVYANTFKTVQGATSIKEELAETQVAIQQNFNLKAGSKVQVNTSDTSFEVELKTFRQRDNVVELSYVNSSGVQIGYRGKVLKGVLYPTEIFNPRKGWSRLSTASYVDIQLSNMSPSQDTDQTITDPFKC